MLVVKPNNSKEFNISDHNGNLRTTVIVSQGPLAEAAPNRTPYHYANNSPVSFSDPTGLYPKKEQMEKIQELQH